MKCTGKEWDTCRVEKMGCTGCYYDEIEVDEYIRTEKGYIFKVDNQKKVLKGIKFLDVQYGHIKKHSKNIIDLIEVGDYINGKRVFATNNRINDNGEKVILTENYDEWTDDGVVSNKDIKSIVTKELFKKTQYKVGE